ncbi:hypothetical protein A3H85_02205 [Candidatus Daviesbacteria bacterium RIFCSPLOWO2_02_FULL_40_8]|uniref:S-adenosylmethionine-dependent methyltransferase domain-containing protein n=1 Tax=Candidatus Daviesbacteria bacterium RIFCSPLOWO2_01_FULL_40_24 TaxID=1797787 RepID=A0A1F5MIY3_9BACT|nr:MAG: hypothetical protein A2780_01530 [Candidatus Daviesbacteria bacterium RIFCSPHIGHO2_01_FULL_41_45]OGE34929.1 MAG: hypothetical protein A3C32_02855 [Candidatus Daviesbacteria bacterium RIFCSPHIGHO2_02_FULL_41_14]OGE65336.1 MAG: hypothetical protein A3B49_03570 [Candidatus Daviesbacteria bacterium RIFCSPLOWO2_01_FULL_40_24]OGE65977.1 MAG: hypothetical protein A3H85_02205 [Candidatus Daviesbacteria bacterium RIFCSPLOWO2_02_FULL_40_8]
MSLFILDKDLLPEYSLLDSGNGKRLEKFGQFILSRPDPQALWKLHLPESEWKKASATFKEGGNSQDRWFKGSVPQKWLMRYKDITFYCKLTPFKHTGVFPEQAIHWDWMERLITARVKSGNKPQILNLFAYTGIASLVATKAGARVTHVDASRPAIGWAKENQSASQLDLQGIRWILDDCLKFIHREFKRGVKYDGIILDPPSFGHGPNGERWEFETHFPKLMDACKNLLSAKPLFLIVNAYAISASHLMLENVLKDVFSGFGGGIEAGELVLKEETNHRLLSTGIFARWSREA